MKAVVAASNQEKALVGAFSVITNLRMELFQALEETVDVDVDSIATLHEKLPFILSRDGILIVPGKNAHEMG